MNSGQRHKLQERKIRAAAFEERFDNLAAAVLQLNATVKGETVEAVTRAVHAEVAELGTNLRRELEECLAAGRQLAEQRTAQADQARGSMRRALTTWLAVLAATMALVVLLHVLELLTR